MGRRIKTTQMSANKKERKKDGTNKKERKKDGKEQTANGKHGVARAVCVLHPLRSLSPCTRRLEMWWEFSPMSPHAGEPGEASTWQFLSALRNCAQATTPPWSPLARQVCSCLSAEVCMHAFRDAPGNANECPVCALPF